ncbi:MAG: cytochrome P450 [Pseudomonadota bacterium]
MSLIDRDIANTIVDPAAYAHWDRSHAAFSHLRKTAPLAVAEPDGFDPFWVVTRHADIKSVELRNTEFHNEDRAAFLTNKAEDNLIKEMTGGYPHIARTLVNMDDPDHAKYRKLTQKWFMPKTLAAIQARIEKLAQETAERMFDAGDACDFAAEIGHHYPLKTIMSVLGVPGSEEARMLKLTQEFFGATDDEYGREADLAANLDAGARAQALQEAMQDIFAMFAPLVEQRRAEPKEDLITLLTHAMIDDAPIGDLERMSYFAIVATAGHDTTAATISSTIWALAERPDLLRRVQDDPSLLRPLIDEATRWETPVKHFMRTATVDTEIDGTPIAAGDWLMLAYPSANRDEAVFEDPFTFDLNRPPSKHLAYGFGPHVCLGQHLARMEMKALWEALLPRLKTLELEGTPTRAAANFVSGPKSVPIRFTLH